MSAGDRELLVFAAKASGLDLKWTGDDYPCLKGEPWDPLENDADAFSLMVRLSLIVNIEEGNAYASDGEIDSSQGRPYSSGYQDASQAARRAIVTVAAGIGRAMP